MNMICLRRLGKLAGLFSLLLALAWPVFAQQSDAAPVAVNGIVRTPEGTPVPGATVRLTNTDTNKSWLSWTDESGKFVFPQIPPGDYRLETSQLGFVATSLMIKLPAVPSGPIPVIARVATAAELAAGTAGSPSANKPANPRGNRSGNGQRADANGGQSAAGANGNTPGERGGRGGRGQVPAGVANAVREGMAGGFEQTELTGEGAGGQAAEAGGGSNNEGTQATARFRTWRIIPAPRRIHFCCKELWGRDWWLEGREDLVRMNWCREILGIKEEAADREGAVVAALVVVDNNLDKADREARVVVDAAAEEVRGVAPAGCLRGAGD